MMDDEVAAFKYVRGSHTGENLARIVMDSLGDLGIVKKVSIPRPSLYNTKFLSIDWMVHDR